MRIDDLKRRDVVAIIDDPTRWSDTVRGALRNHAGRVVVLRDALDALERVPVLRPGVLLIPERPNYATPVQIARNLRNRMRRNTPRLVLVGNGSRYAHKELALFDEHHDTLPLSRIERLFAETRPGRDTLATA